MGFVGDRLATQAQRGNGCWLVLVILVALSVVTIGEVWYAWHGMFA